MKHVSTINVVNDDVQIVQVGSGNVVNSVPTDMAVNMRLQIDSKDPVMSLAPSINIYVGDGKVKNELSQISDKDGVKVKVTESTLVSEVKYIDADTNKFCGYRLTEKAFGLLTGFFSRKCSYGYSCNLRGRDSQTIMDRLNVVIEPGDVLLTPGTFVLYIGEGCLIRLDSITRQLGTEKLDVKSEYERWELWNDGKFCDYFTPPERVARAKGLVGSEFEGSDSDFIAWCFTGMTWTEASENGYKLYCR